MNNTIIFSVIAGMIVIFVILFVVFNMRKGENFIQPLGPCGWGYRNPYYTHSMLQCQQNQTPQLVINQKQPQFNYVGCGVDTAPVAVALNKCMSEKYRPKFPKILQRPVATAHYSSW